MDLDSVNSPIGTQVKDAKQRLVVIPGGSWSTNIGNAFLNLGLEYVLKQVFPNDRIVIFNDQPGYRWMPSRGNPKNDMRFLDQLRPDVFVLHATLLIKEFDRLMEETLLQYQKQGTLIMYVGVSAMGYDQREVEHVRSILKRIKPAIFVSRDEWIYKNYADLAEHSYSGIDVGFFVSDLFEPVPMENSEDFAVFNFDIWPEPKFGSTPTLESTSEFKRTFSYLDTNWKFEFPPLRTRLCQKYLPYRYIDGIFPAPQVEKFGPYKIVRPDHSFNPPIVRNTYKSPNAFVSDIPTPYLNLYANSKVTFSNRVHACVATLAYGNPAMIFTKSPRLHLMDRLGIVDITKKPVLLPKERLDQEKAAMIEFLREAVKNYL